MSYYRDYSVMSNNPDMWEVSPEITIKYTWENIPWISILDKLKPGDCIESPTFCYDEYEDTKWRLLLYPKGWTDEFSDWVSIFVKCESTEYLAAEPPSKVDISIYNYSTAYCTKPERHVHNVDGKFIYLGFPKFFVSSKLNSMIEHERRIVCKIQTRGPIRSRTNDWILNNEIGQLLDSERFSDVKLQVKDKYFPAHKNILAVRSPVFSAMFNHEMLENTENIVTINKFDDKIVKEMLRYIYTGKTPNFKETVFDLLPAADHYQLDELKTMCEIYLCNNLSVDDVMEIMVLADAHGSTKLKEKAIKFFNEHPKPIIATEVYKAVRMSHPNLMLECFEASVTEDEDY